MFGLGIGRNGMEPFRSWGRFSRSVPGWDIIFPEFFGHFKYRKNLKYKNSRKQELALGCTELIGLSKYDQKCKKVHLK